MVEKKILVIEFLSEEGEEINIHNLEREIDNAIFNCDDSGITRWITEWKEGN